MEIFATFPEPCHGVATLRGFTCRIFRHRYKLFESKSRGAITRARNRDGRAGGNLESHVPGFSKF